MVRWRSGVLATLVVAVLGACSGGSESSLSGTWVYADRQAVIYLDVVDNDGNLAGTMRIATVDGESVDHDDGSFTGLVSDGRLALDFGGATLSGQAGDGRIELTLPAGGSSGALRQVDLRRGDLGDYNAALGQLEGAAADRHAQRLAGESAAAAVRQADADRQAVEWAREQLDFELASLRDWINGDGSIDHFAEAWTSYGDALARLRDRDAELAAAVDDGAECGDLQSLMGDVQSARGDVASAHGDYESADGDAASAVADGERYIDNVLSEAEDAGEAGSTAVTDAVSDARGAIGRIEASRGDAENQASDFDDEGDSLVETAESRLPEDC